MSFSLYVENTSEITISLSSFQQKMKNTFEKLLDFAQAKQQRLKGFSLDLNYVKNSLKDYPDLNNLLIAIQQNNLQALHGETYKVYKWLTDHQMMDRRDIWKYLDDYTSSINNEYNIANLEKIYDQNLKKLLADSLGNMNKIKSMIQARIATIPDWNQSPLRLEAVESYDSSFNNVALEPADSCLVFVGQQAYFGLYHDGQKFHVDDILEDDDFFQNTPKIKSDYFVLIKELQNPGSSQQGKILTLYTARPQKDREFYRSTNYLPINIFLTNSFSHVDGLAVDLGSDEVRDVWKVRINEKYLVKTLDGPVKYYCVIKDKAPVVSIDLY